MTCLHTVVETVISEVRKLFRIGGVPASLTLFFLAVADGLFGLCGSECLDELFISTRFPPPPPPPPPSLISLTVFVDVKLHERRRSGQRFVHKRTPISSSVRGARLLIFPCVRLSGPLSLSDTSVSTHPFWLSSQRICCCR